MDDRTDNVDIIDNTLFNAEGWNFLHNSNHINVKETLHTIMVANCYSNTTLDLQLFQSKTALSTVIYLFKAIEPTVAFYKL